MLMCSGTPSEIASYLYSGAYLLSVTAVLLSATARTVALYQRRATKRTRIDPENNPE